MEMNFFIYAGLGFGVTLAILLLCVCIVSILRFVFRCFREKEIEIVPQIIDLSTIVIVEDLTGYPAWIGIQC